MKKFLTIFSVAAVMTACTSNQKSETDAAATLPAVTQPAALNIDTTGLAQFKEWKQQELVVVQDTKPEVQYKAPVKKARKVYHAPVYKETASVPAPVATTTSTPGTTTAPASEGTVGNGSAGNGTMSSESTNTAETPEKKGWSKAAKGAVIGGATGAAAGAVINKRNRVVGAVIGGVIGAGGGFVIGRKMDKKDGR